MFVRVIMSVLLVLLVSACGGMSSDSAKSSSSKKAYISPSSQSVIDKYRVASENLDPFSALVVSNVDAKASDRVFFNYDSAVISSDQQKILDRQAGWLKKNPNKDVSIEGHCDERGTREYNLSLGARRAEAIKIYLEAKGISRQRISTISYGKERPVVLGGSHASYAENRRGVTVIK